MSFADGDEKELEYDDRRGEFDSDSDMEAVDADGEEEEEENENSEQGISLYSIWDCIMYIYMSTGMEGTLGYLLHKSQKFSYS